MKKIDICSAVTMLVLSVLVAVGTWDLPYWSGPAPGPAFASFWLAGSGALIGAVMLVQAVRRPDAGTVDWPDRTGGRQVLAGIGLLWLMLVMLPLLGTAVSGVIFMLLFLLGIARRPVFASVATSLVTVAIIEGVFDLWLNVDLPKGVLGF